MKSRILVYLAVTLAASCLCLFIAGFLAGYLAGSSATDDAPVSSANGSGQDMVQPVVPEVTKQKPLSGNATQGNATNGDGLAGAANASVVAGPEAVPEPPPPMESQAGYAVQTGAFLYKDNAVAMADELAGEGCNATIYQQDSGGKTWFFVRFGEFATFGEAADQARKYRAVRKRPVVVAETGTAKVTKIGEAKPVYLLQVAAFPERSLASVKANALTRQGRSACIVEVLNKKDEPWFLVVLGKFASRAEAAASGKKYAAATGGEYYIQPLAAEIWELRKSCPE